MDNTPISAVTLPNNNRHLYFHERDGAIRRVVFSSSAQQWQTPRSYDDAQILEDYRNNTPIAVIPGFELNPRWDYPLRSFRRPANLNDVVLFFVNSTGQLECVGWKVDGSSGDSGCDREPLGLLPSVAQDSSHFSAGLYDFKDGGLGLLLTYQNSSRDLVMMLGYVNPGDDTRWIWQDETKQLPVCSINDTACQYGKTLACHMQSDTIFCVQENRFSYSSTYFTSGNKFRLEWSKPFRTIPLVTVIWIIHSVSGTGTHLGI